MKKIILTLVILAFTAAMSFSQTATTYDKNSIHITGSAELTGGTFDIKYDVVPSFKDIYVSLTPVGAYLELYVAKKENGIITVKCNNSLTGKFDYVVIEKREREVPGNVKNK